MNEFESRWIKIRPQHPMPRAGECVLIGHSSERHVGEARFHKEQDGAFWFEGLDGTSVANPKPTHWMSLPAPPEEFKPSVIVDEIVKEECEQGDL